jgi:hypothetical protein
MVVGTLFTLIVVPVFYSLLASKHQRIAAAEEGDLTAVEQPA